MRGWAYLTRFELYKIARQPAALVSFFLIVGWICFSSFGWADDKNVFSEELGTHLDQSTYDLLQALRPEVESLVNRGAVNDMVQVPDLRRAYRADDIYRIIVQMDYIENSEGRKTTYIGRAQSNVEALEGDPHNLYAKRYNAAVRDVLLARKWPALLFGWQQGQAILLLGGHTTFNLFDILFALFCLLGLCAIFTRDHELRTRAIVLSTKCGHNMLFFSKLCAGGLFIAGSLLFFMAQYLVLLGIKFGFEDFSAPIHSLPLFEKSLYNMNFFRFWLTLFALKFLSVLLLFLFASVVGLLTRKRFAALMSAAVVYGVFFFLATVEMTGANGLSVDKSYARYFVETWSYVLNPAQISIQPVRYFSSFRYANVFGYPIPELTVSIFIAVLLGLAFLLAGRWLYMRKDDFNGLRIPASHVKKRMTR
jgi:hypothetical protein